MQPPLTHPRFDAGAERQLAALADQLADGGQQLRGLHNRVRGSAANLGWHSPAARVFEVGLSGGLGQLGRLAGLLDELASSVRGHAVHAEQLASALRRLPAEAARAAQRLRHLW